MLASPAMDTPRCLTWSSIWLLVCCAYTAAADSSSPSDPIIARFPSDKQKYRFTHMVVDPRSNQLYAGATNKLLQLSPNLELIESVSTGPRNDSSLCHARGCNNSPEIHTSLVDNINKMLVLDPDSRILIVCGSLHQGACYKYQVSNISLKPEFITISIAANDETSSTYAYIGPKKYNPWGHSNVLYVGTTFTNNGEYRHDVPAIASRNLDNLQIAEYSFSKQSQLTIDVKYRDHFLVQYVYGFNASEYAYFVIVQKQSHLPGQEEQGYISRLARTCIIDSNYDSYTEVTLQCVKEEVDGKVTNYNLVQDAKITRAGDELAKRLNIKPNDEVLVAVFRQARGITNEPQSQSALCMYSLKDIELKFDQNIHKCLNGSVKYRNMGYVSGLINDGKCLSAGMSANIQNFCDVGLKISGNMPIIGQAVLTFPNVSLSSVTTATPGKYLPYFLNI